jgi:hypothetical protein
VIVGLEYLTGGVAGQLYIPVAAYHMAKETLCSTKRFRAAIQRFFAEG